MDYAIPASKIASLSSGQFVGMMADDPDNKIVLKVFHNEIQNDHEALKKADSRNRPIPAVKKVTEEEIMETYKKIKNEIVDLVNCELTLLEAKEILEAVGQQAVTDIVKDTEQSNKYNQISH